MPLRYIVPLLDSYEDGCSAFAIFLFKRLCIGTLSNTKRDYFSVSVLSILPVDDISQCFNACMIVYTEEKILSLICNQQSIELVQEMLAQLNIIPSSVVF